MARPFIILDRDGTIIVERNYLSDPAGVELLPGAADGMRTLREHGYGLIAITNQSGIGRGYYDVAQLSQIHERMNELLRQAGAEQLDQIYFCPHTPEDGCECRKPKPALLLRAAAEFGFDPKLCIVIGDKECDIELGRAVGARTVLVRTGYGREFEEKGLTADYIADDLHHAAKLVS